MAIALLDRRSAATAVEQAIEQGVEQGVCRPIAGAEQCLARAGRAAVQSLDDGELADAVSALARMESRAAALRLALSAEAEGRRVTERTAETATDAWVARLTGSTREQAAGGLRIARLLQGKYAATRAAFAAGDLRLEQVVGPSDRQRRRAGPRRSDADAGDRGRRLAGGTGHRSRHPSRRSDSRSRTPPPSPPGGSSTWPTRSTGRLRRETLDAMSPVLEAGASSCLPMCGRP